MQTREWSVVSKLYQHCPVSEKLPIVLSSHLLSASATPPAAFSHISDADVQHINGEHICFISHLLQS